MNEFITFINQYITLSEAAENAIRSIAKVEELEKGTTLLEEGKTCKKFYFLAYGTIRTFFYQKGKDITNWIYPENSMVTSWHSYLNTQPATEYMETIEDAVLVTLTHDQWNELYENYPELERFGRHILEEQMALIDTFFRGYYFLTAKEKYELLTNSYPTITNRANLGHIASMLGISQETLSRIRGK